VFGPKALKGSGIHNMGALSITRCVLLGGVGGWWVVTDFLEGSLCNFLKNLLNFLLSTTTYTYAHPHTLTCPNKLAHACMDTHTAPPTCTRARMQSRTARLDGKMHNKCAFGLACYVHGQVGESALIV
jgi:hypothetical protein